MHTLSRKFLGFVVLVAGFFLVAIGRQSKKTINKLGVAKEAFLAPLEIIADARSIDDVEGAKSLRELWDLRTEVYGIIAIHSSQDEANVWLQSIEKYFPAQKK